MSLNCLVFRGGTVLFADGSRTGEWMVIEITGEQVCTLKHLCTNEYKTRKSSECIPVLTKCF